MDKPIPIENLIERFKTCIVLQKELQLEEVNFKFTEHDMKSILFYLFTYRDIRDNYHKLF